MATLNFSATTQKATATATATATAPTAAAATQNKSSSNNKSNGNGEKATNTITLADPEIVGYFRENPHLDAETTVLVFVNIMKQLSTNLSDTMNSTANSKMLGMLTTLTSEVGTMKRDMQIHHENAMKGLVIKFHEFKRDYLEELKLNISNVALANNETLHTILEKNSDALIDKTHLLINEIVPKSSSQIYTKIDTCLDGLKTSIKQDTSTLLNNISRDDRSFKEYYDMIDRQIGAMITQVQQPIMTYIQNSEERTTTHMGQIRDKLTETHSTQSSLNTDLSAFLNKYKYQSSAKGAVSENHLMTLLQKMYPSDEVLDVGKQASTCDIRLNRRDANQATILFENKDYAQTVPTLEIEKFERDVEAQGQHGIFLSQSTGITYKNNFQIDIKRNLIHVYIPNCEYSAEKIQIGVDMITALAPRLHVMAATQSVSICKDDLESLMSDYTEFQRSKKEIVEIIRLNARTLTDRVETLQHHTIRKVLEKNNVMQCEETNKCKYCNFVGKGSKASLSAHVRACKQNPANK
jgi:hypothetical protein